MLFQVTLTVLLVSYTTALQCTCLKSGNHVTCTNGLSNKWEQLYNSVRMDTSKGLLKNAVSFPETKSLYMHCDIEYLQLESFKNQEILETLDLSRNLIDELPHNFFHFTPRISNLNLSRNKFKKLSIDTFSNLKSLKILNLSNNQLTKIDVGVLDDMALLTELYLNNNKIAILSSGVLDQVIHLQKLDLSKNKLTRIETNLFDYTELLQDVNLSGNELNDEIALSGLSRLSSVVNLNLSNCNINTLKGSTFSKLTNLETIDISFNSITLWPKMFENSKDLTSVYMSHSNIRSVPIDFFDNNLQLEKVDLSHNHLMTLPKSLFNKTLNFKYLNISHNSFKDLPTEIFQWTSLTQIDLSYNEFTTILPELLNMETLETIYAQHNKISYFEDMAFSSCTFPIRYIDLSYNRLVYLQEYFFDWLANLEELQIFGNPWDCRCLQDLIALLSKRFIRYDEEDYQSTSAICVAGDPNVCPYYTTNLTYYYNAFKTI